MPEKEVSETEGREPEGKETPEPKEHYSAKGIGSEEEESAYQESEYEAFFNSEEEEEVGSYALVEGEAGDILHQIEITNGLLGTTNAILIVIMIYGVMRFVMRLVSHNVFKYL